METKDIMDMTPLGDTEFEVDSTIWYWYIDTEFGDINGIFKSIKPTNDVPFVSMNGIHKVHRDLDIIPSTWNNEINDIITMIYPISQGDTTRITKIEIQFDEDEKKFAIVMELSKDFIKEKSIESIYNNVKLMFRNPTDGEIVKFTNYLQTDISGIFFVKDVTLKQYLLLDMITNDASMSKFFTIDEYDSVTKRHLTIGFHKDTVRDEIPSTFTFTITQPIKRSVRIKIRKPQVLKDIKIFTNILTRALAYYEKNRGNVAQIYSQFGITELVSVDDPKTTPRTQSDKKGGSRSCPKSRKISEFVDRDEAKAAMYKTAPDGTAIGEEHILQFPLGEKDAKYYVCKHKATPYPGMVKLTKASTGNVLCCSKKPQVGDPKSGWSKYANPDSYVGVKYKNEYELGGNKMLSEDRTGETPEVLKFLNRFIEVDRNNSIVKDFKRLGVAPSEKSILTCLRKATGGTDIVGDSIFATAKQELYDHTIFEIEQKIRNPRYVMKYSEFASFLEEVYNIKLIVFGGEGVVTPRYVNGFYRRYNDKPVVVLFEQPDHQYELITLQEYTKPSRSIYMFDQGSEVAETFKPFLDKQLEFKIKGKTIQNTDIEIPVGWKIVSQQFDSYGKTRRINIQSPTEVFSIYTSPLQPYSVPEDTDPVIKPYDSAKLARLQDGLLSGIEYLIVEEEGFTIIDVGAVTIKIPTVAEGDLTMTFPTTSSSNINSYIAGRRIATYLIENALWLESKNPGSISDKIIVNKKYVYNKQITKKFDLNSAIYYEGKIIVNNRDIRDRILFNVKMMKMRNPEKLKTYEKMTFVPNFYSNTTDFIDSYDKRAGNGNMKDMTFNVFTGNNIFTYQEENDEDDEDEDE